MLKLMAKSKTILGIVLVALVALLPELGIQFTDDDAALISTFWDLVLQTVGASLGIYGRVVAKGPLK